MYTEVSTRPAVRQTVAFNYEQLTVGVAVMPGACDEPLMNVRACYAFY